MLSTPGSDQAGTRWRRPLSVAFGDASGSILPPSASCLLETALGDVPMLCPNCKTENLVTIERQTIQIDHCPRCRGVWLDRGELEKLLQMSAVEDGRQSGEYNGREFGEDEETPRGRGRSDTEHDDDDDDAGERGERSGSKEQDDEGESERGRAYRGREGNDDDSRGERGGAYRSRERDDDTGRERGGSYENRDRGGDRGTGGREPSGKSIWRDIFENLGDRIPRP
jgi:uncharacterized protein